MTSTGVATAIGGGNKRDWNRLTEEEDLLERKPKARTEISTYVREKEGTRTG